MNHKTPLNIYRLAYTKSISAVDKTDALANNMSLTQLKKAIRAIKAKSIARCKAISNKMPNGTTYEQLKSQHFIAYVNYYSTWELWGQKLISVMRRHFRMPQEKKILGIIVKPNQEKFNISILGFETKSFSRYPSVEYDIYVCLPTDWSQYRIIGSTKNGYSTVTLEGRSHNYTIRQNRGYSFTITQEDKK